MPIEDMTEATRTHAIGKAQRATPIAGTSSLFPITFGAIFGANVLTMSLMNVTEARTSDAPAIYLVSLALTALLMAGCKARLPSLSIREHALCAALSLIFSLPRLGYLFEHMIGYSLAPLGDDAFHIPNFASIIHSQTFPPRSTYDQREYLAYYYAPWMPGAVLYYGGLANTVKEAMGITKIIYCLLISYSLFYASRLIFQERKLQISFLIICLLYGGFDFIFWLAQCSFIPTHSEWWAAEFGFILQYSNFITLALWTPQHLLAAICALFCLYLLHATQGRIRDAMIGLLLLSALFSSPFSVFGTLPIAVWYAIKYKKLSSAPVAAAVFALVSIPLWWILLGNERVGVQLFGALSSLWEEHKILAFAAFLLILSLELGPLIVAAAHNVRSNAPMRTLFALCAAYLLSTFFVFYSENYSMRGSIAPIFGLTYLATPVAYEWWEKARGNWLWLRLAFAAYALGGVLEYAQFCRAAAISFRSSITEFNAAALRSNEESGPMTTLELTQQAPGHPLGWQVLEKNKPIPKAPLIIDEARQMHPDNCYRVTVSRVVERDMCPSTLR